MAGQSAATHFLLTVMGSETYDHIAARREQSVRNLLGSLQLTFGIGVWHSVMALQNNR